MNIKEMLEGNIIPKEEIKKAFAESLKTLREYTKISLIELEKATGINNPTLSRYENGLVEPSISNGYIIAKFFQLNLSDFIFYSYIESEKDIIETFEDKITSFIYMESVKGTNKKNESEVIKYFSEKYIHLDIQSIYNKFLQKINNKG